MKTCLITGASGGVATALAQQLRAQGWRLALVSRDAGKLAPAEGELAIEADVATEAGAEAALAQATEAFGHPPDAVAHCAGAILIAPIGRTSEAQYRACMAANLDSAFFVSRAYAPRVQKSDRPGALLFFSSVAATTPLAPGRLSASTGCPSALVRYSRNTRHT